MNYNFEEQFYPFQSAQESRYMDPLEYIDDESARPHRSRTSLEGVTRAEEIPSFDPLNPHLGLKKIFSSNSHDMFNEEDDKLCEINDLKYELSEEHRHIEDLKEVVEMNSYLRDRATNIALSGEGLSNGEFEQISHVEIPNSNEESSGDCPLSEMFDASHDSAASSSSKISREGLRRLKRTSTCFTSKGSSYRQRKTDDQVKILTDLYQKHNGKLNRKVRKEAMSQTGLAWIQIYKWFFDRQLKKSAIEKACCT